MPRSAQPVAVSFGISGVCPTDQGYQSIRCELRHCCRSPGQWVTSGAQVHQRCAHMMTTEDHVTPEGSTIVGPHATTPDNASLREVLGHFCTGVAVIPAYDGQHPAGFTCE